MKEIIRTHWLFNSDWFISSEEVSISLQADGATKYEVPNITPVLKYQEGEVSSNACDLESVLYSKLICPCEQQSVRDQMRHEI